jgi:hypothetical protein
MGFQVFDTYVKSKNGHIMHFDVITDKNNTEKAIMFAKEWLKSIYAKLCDSHKILNLE